jgi:osmotically-inducible protein OsmY
MTQLFRRFARLLAVAGGCSLASWSLAGTPDSAYAPAAAMNLTPAQARLEAMKVEVALLGDPVTIRLPLGISVEGDGVVLRGQVPDETSRARALEVARQSCYLPVKDALTVPVKSSVGGLAIKQGARDTLIRQMGSKADRFVITATDDGQVKLDGDVASVEEKLQASRALRSVPGCTRVVNCLSVRGVEQANHLITVVSSDGQSVVCTPKADQPRPELDLERVQYSPEIYPPVPQVRQTVPSGLPLGPAASTAAVPPQPVTPAQTASAGCNCTQGAVYSHERPTMLERLSAWRHARVARRHQPATVKQEVATPTARPQPAASVMTVQPAQPARKGKPQHIDATPVSAPRLVPTPAEPPAPAEGPRLTGDATPWPPAYRTAPPATPAPADAMFQSRPLASLRPQARPVAPPPAPQLPPVVQPDEAAPSPTVVQAASRPEPKVPAPAEPVAAPVPLVKSEDRPEKAAPPPIRLTEKELSKRVSDACGKLAKEVRIEVGGDRGIIVHVYALPATEHLLVARLLHVPELGARNVQLHVHLAK